MQQEDYVSFEVAKLLKEKSAFLVSDHHYFSEDINIGDSGIFIPKGNLTQMFKISTEFDHIKIYAPTLYDVQKWLRNEHDLHVSVGVVDDCSYDADGKVCEEWTAWTFSVYYITNLEHPMIDCLGNYDTYEEALNEGLREALKLI